MASALGKAGQHQAVDWLSKLKSHVNNVGVGAALDTLSQGEANKNPIVNPGEGGQVQYLGADKDLPDFVDGYLRRHGITAIPSDSPDDRDQSTPAVSSTEKGFIEDGTLRKGDFVPRLPKKAVDKLAEAKMLPGLEKSVALPKSITHLTPRVTDLLDKKFGKDKWIVKPYGDEGAAGAGVFFPQYARQIQQNAQKDIWNAGSELSKYGFHLQRNSDGNVIGLRHESGDIYPFGSKRYKNVIHGEVRKYGDIAAGAAENEKGPVLTGNENMAQPAFDVVGISEAERAAGVTGATGGKGEGRTHIFTHKGKAYHIPSSTWLKGEHVPVVFENDDTKKMKQAALDAINALPESERQGQVYAPDIINAKDGKKVIELNPSNATGTSGYLTNNPMIIDSYVSHLTGQEPQHVKMIKSLLSSKKKSINNPDDSIGKNSEGGQRSGSSRAEGLVGNDSERAGGFDGTKPKTGIDPSRFAEALKQEGALPLKDGSSASKTKHNENLFLAAEKSGMLISRESLAAIRSLPNVGGGEHNVHEDPGTNKFYKFNKLSHYDGMNGDIFGYIKRHEIANKLWPELGYRFHGVTSNPKLPGRAQTVMSMNRIEGTHPEQKEVSDWFSAHGFREDDDPEHNGSGATAWKDPKTGIVIRDAHARNFIKTSKGLVPIDVDIVPGEK